MSKFDNMGDDALLREMGTRLARHRLNRNVTQADLARDGGIARRTVSKVENGHVIDSRSLLRILRALDLLDGLDALIPTPRISPVSLVKSRGKQRQRARGGATQVKREGVEWRWPDEEE